MRPRNWSEALGRLALYMPPHDAEEWLREAVLLAFDATSLRDATPTIRALAFQKTIIVGDLLERDGCPLDMIGPDGHRDFLLWRCGSITEAEGPTYRERIQAAFSRSASNLWGREIRRAASHPSPRREPPLAVSSFVATTNGGIVPQQVDVMQGDQ